MSTQRASWAAAERLLPRLSDRDWAILYSLKRSRVLTGHQLGRLHFFELSNLTQHRTTRLVLKRLTDWQLLTRLDRAIGGVRAGSTGWVYSLEPLGHRLIQLQTDSRDDQRIRKAWTPSLLFLKHSLAVAELYVQLAERSRSAAYQLAEFVTEPDCWWSDGLGSWLKPDAYLVLRTLDYDELVWLEVDRATESLPTLKRKMLGYQNFVERGQLGPDGIMPHVVISTPTWERANAVQKIIEPAGLAQGIFTVTTFAHASKHLVDLATSRPDKPP